METWRPAKGIEWDGESLHGETDVWIFPRRKLSCSLAKFFKQFMYLLTCLK
jgi:hypothetical protein